MILLFSDDLLDASKTMASGRAADLLVVKCDPRAEIGETQQDITCCIIDLQHPKLDLDLLLKVLDARTPKPRLIAYGSHVDAERLSEARKAGCDEVLPRSKYFEVMPERLAQWAKTP